MKDKYLEKIDRIIASLKNSCCESKGDIQNLLFELLDCMDEKTTYIAQYPERAKNHYSKNRDAAFVRSVRTSLGLTQEAFGYRLGVTATTVNRWENGKMPLSDERSTFIEVMARCAKDTPSWRKDTPSWKKDIVNSLLRGE